MYRFDAHDAAFKLTACPSQQSAVATSLCDYVLDSPDKSDEVASFPTYGALQIVDDLRELAMRNYSANRIYVPAIQTLTALLEANVAEEKLEDDEAATAQCVKPQL